MSKPHIPIKKGASPCGHIEVSWGRKAQDGHCNVCSHDDERSASRWVAIIKVRNHVTILCPAHLRELQNTIDKLNHPTAARHLNEDIEH